LLQIEKARMSDVPLMHQMINAFADQDDMLPRPLSELYEHIRDFFVVRDGGQFFACTSLHIDWEDLAEIRSLAVATDHQGKGYGAKLVQACLKEAKSLGISMVYTLTYKPGFFETQGFKQVEKMTLPRKVWAECFHCPKFPDCDEVALTYRFDEES